jgi:RNA polymerase sigma factor (sigma-70 family)
VPASRPLAEVTTFDEVLQAARANEPWAYHVVYDTLAGRVCGYFESRGVQDAEDLTSEVFLRVFDHIADFDGGEASFRSWVFTIAYRLMVDDYRRSRRRPLHVELPAVMAEALVGGDAETDSLAHLDQAWVAEVLADLRDDQREVLTLRVVGDLTVEQVAGVIGKSPGAVKALQRRAAANLRRRLTEAKH